MVTLKGSSGQAPYGYAQIKNELILVTHEAAIYSVAFDLYLINQRVGTTTKILNKKGFRNRAGKEFKTKSVGYMLKNPVAKGIYRRGMSEVSENGEQIDNVIEKSVPPIVSVAIWDLVQTILIENSGTQSRPPTQDYFIGKLTCHCDTPLELPSKSSEYRCFNCSQRVSKNDILSAFESQIGQLSLPEQDVLSELSNTSLNEIKTNPKNMLNDVERDIEQLYKLHSSEAITEDIFKQRFDVLNNRKSQLHATIEDAKMHNSSYSFIEHWQALSKEHKRILIENLVDSIIVAPDKITLRLFPLFNFAQQVDISPS